MGPLRSTHPAPLRLTLDIATLWAADSPPMRFPRRDGRAMANDPTDRTPTGRAPAAVSTRSEIDAFLAQVKGLAPSTAAGARGRLIFALDATMSRQPTWDTACQL